MNELSEIATRETWRVVDDEFRTGQQKPEWWAEIRDREHTVFVPSSEPMLLKNAALREHARREGFKLSTKRVVVNSMAGTVYWMTGLVTYKTLDEISGGTFSAKTSKKR